MIVEVIAVGTELLLGQIVNSNAAEIGTRLADAGLVHYHQTVVGDNLDRVADAMRLALSRSDAVIVTGGIGPTQDDITREAMCAAAGRDMAFDDEYADRLRLRWAERGMAMPESNLRQAEYPAGADRIPNPKGTAPGLAMEAGGRWLFALPGVPQEMVPMLDGHVIPFLQERAGHGDTIVLSRLIRTWGESESRVADLLGDLFAESANPTLAFLASSGEIKIRLTARAESAARARTLIEPLEQEICRRLGSRVFGFDGDTVEQVVLREAAGRGWSLGTAESATGGLVATRITSVPGASETFRGSIVAYATGVKRDVLAVSGPLMEEHGVVAPETALAMAEGAASRLAADVVVAVTGSAGPDPQEQPVGTMVIAVRTPEDARARTMRLPGDRERVRVYAATAALHLTRLALVGRWWRD